MSNNWNGFALTIPTAITTLLQTLSSASSIQQTFLEGLKTQALSAVNTTLDQTDIKVQLTNQALQTALTGLTNLIESLLDDTGFYVLPIPIPKKGLLGFVAHEQTEEEGTTEIRFPITQLPPEIRSLPIFDPIFNAVNIFTGGNAHYIKTIGEALFDAGDVNRPRFQKTDQWAYMALLAGSEDLSTILSLASAAETIFGTRNSSPINRGATSVVPTNVNGRISTRNLRAVLQWDPPPVSRVIQSLGNAVIQPTHFAIIRSKNWEFKSTTCVLDVFPTNELTVGMVGRYGATVVDIQEYDGITNQWTDTNILEGSMFYTVAFRTSYQPPIGNLEPITEFFYNNYATPVEIKQVGRNQNIKETTSQLPDWYRTPSLTALLPPVNDFMDLVIEKINSLSQSASTVTQRNSEYIRYLEREIIRYKEQVDAFTQLAARLQQITLATNKLGGAYIRTATGTGNASSFLSDLAQSFSDTNSAPPFINGTEYTCGLLILAVGPDISGIKSLFDTLFGQSSDESPTEQLLKEGIDSIQTIMAVADQNIIDLLSEPRTNNSEGFNTNLTPSSDGSDATCNH